MRPIIPAIGLAILLAACQFALPGAGGKREAASSGIAPDAIEVTSLDAPAAPGPDAPAPMAAVAPAADSAAPASAPPPEAAAADAAAERPKTNAGEPRPEEAPPLLKSEAWIACEKRGGVWERAAAGSAAFCQMPTRDGGKQCRRSTDCEGYCLARSGTCAPVTPLLGCQDILNENGRMLTQCIN
jgi:hypothetical protein